MPNLRYHLKRKKISPNLAVRSECRQISQNLNGRFSLNFPDSYMAIRWIICASLGEFLCAKLEISLKTQENISKLAVCSERRQIFQNLNGRFSLNFPDSYMAMRWIICASLGEFLCAKLEISLKTQKNIFRSEQNLTKVDYLKI